MYVQYINALSAQLRAPDGGFIGVLPPGFELLEEVGNVYFWPNVRQAKLLSSLDISPEA